MKPIADANVVSLPTLNSQEIHVWWSRLDQLDTAVYPWRLLSQDEQTRASRFKRDRDRNRYILTRSILRQLIASYLRIPAVDVQFCYGKKGKPTLDISLSDATLEFNVSHSQDFALWGFSHHALGIDVEYIKPGFQTERIAQRFFTTQEYTALQAQPIEVQQDFFFTLWTRKESCIKAWGESLFEKIGQIDVPCSTPGSCQWLPLPSNASLYVQDLSLHPDYRAAIACVSDGLELSCFEFDKTVGLTLLG